MRIRDPYPDDAQPPREPEPVTEVAYRVPGRHTAAMLGLALALVLGGWYSGRPAGWLICGLLALAFAAFAARDLIAPVRLRADRHGVEVISGFAGRHRLAWGDIDRVRVDERVRWGRETQTLEIDAGEALYLFSARDLGAPPAEVAGVLDRLRS
ncbi:PH domain-containing protein [Luedemannella helvata]|uniref:Low molecular weight protein antigen 6 PH domain-containing protein n=1 Tax=Luedemannella helvata TaxID=349315 RepID=A0ABP4W6I8_9ACTN